MDSTFSAQDEAFRLKIRDFFSSQFTDDLRDRLREPETLKAAQIEWQRKLYDQGWIATGWPQEYGGTGWTATQKYIYESERSAAGVPDVVPFGLLMVGPVIYTFGTEAQKEKFLPRILKSEDWWCQGYSEPGSGSDLASLKTKAELVDGHYIVNGAKIWTTYAQYADWIFCLVRTDKESTIQGGISFLLIDMNSPGVKVNPIIGIDNRHTLNEVVFTDVKVPAENLIGEQGRGWTYAKFLLQHERTAIAGVGNMKHTMALVKQQASRQMVGGRSLAEDEDFQRRFTEIEVELMALEYTELRALDADERGTYTGIEPSILKIKGTELQQSIQRLRLDMAGYYSGSVVGQQVEHEFAQEAYLQYMYGRAATIYGGSNEIQRNIITKAAFGL